MAVEENFRDKNLRQIKQKLDQGERLDKKDALILYQSKDILGIGALADRVRQQKHGKQAFYVYNQHLNYSNICRNRCLFCAYAKDADEQGAFTLSYADIEDMILKRITEPVQEVHIVGGLNPAFDFDYFLDLIKVVKKHRPQATVKAFTAVEIDYLCNISGLSLEPTISRLKQAGLGMLPGGGAEVMNQRVRKKLFPKKIDHLRWLEIMQAVHRAGLPSNATMLYGHIETLEERVEHLFLLRELQDKTRGFSAFIPLAFHSQNTRLSHLPATTAYDDLKNIAVARLVLDNFPHIKAYWVMIGEALAQLALSFGADDLDGTIIEEKITHMAGAKSARGLTQMQIQDLIKEAGYTPVQRDSYYRPVKQNL